MGTSVEAANLHGNLQHWEYITSPLITATTSQFLFCNTVIAQFSASYSDFWFAVGLTYTVAERLSVLFSAISFRYLSRCGGGRWILRYLGR